MSFASALDQLDALGLELSPAVPRRKFDLEHMRILARALGDPQTKFPSVLIAGTNGKGSTAATLASILAASGLRTGLYTSPHLARITERIRVSQPPTSNLQPETLTEIPEPDFARLYFRVDDAARALVLAGQLPHHPSYFETLTALAFLYFAESALDIAVLEVGLGGRLDATNIVEPLLSVITDIALDHQDYLGPTISAIAREKAGILRPNGTLITLPQHPEANQAIGEAAIALNVHATSATPYLPFRTHVEPRTLNLEPEPPPLPANHYTLHLDGQPLHVHSPLAGEHQRRNIALAIAAALELRNHFDHKSIPSNLEPRTSNLEPGITLASIEAGIASTSWPGRLEFLPPNLLLDVAHNPAGAWTLRAAIAALPESQPRTLIFSCLRDKDLAEMAQILFPLFDAPAPRPSHRTAPASGYPEASASGLPTPNQEGALAPGASSPLPLNLILTPIDSPRAAPLEALIAAARALDIPAHTATSPADALALARRITPADGLILATGSVYLIGALRSLALATNPGAPS